MSANFTPTLGDVTELKPFRFWCQKVLPLVFDDTLSYYELLCKVVDYLNNTMADVNTLSGDVENLHTAYEQLQEYVNTYFSSLDLQEEINAKLDAMAESGVLSTLIAPYISPAVSEWLEENIEPTTPVVDNSLTVSGAAADAKVTGDKITSLSSALRECLSPGLENKNSQIRALLAMYLDFGDPATEASFWGGTHTHDGNTYNRNIGLALITANTSLSFYWFNNSNRFIAGDSAFTITKNDQVINTINNVKVYKKAVTLDSVSATVYAMVDWTKTAGATGVYQGYYDKENIEYYKALFTFFRDIEIEKRDKYPLVCRDTSSSFNETLLKAVRGLYFDFGSESAADTFWNGSHSYGQTTTQSRNIGLNVVNVSNMELGFYFLNDSYGFISGDQAFQITQSETNIIVMADQNIGFVKKSVTLDNTDCTVYAIIDWDVVAGASSGATSNYYYNKADRAEHKLITKNVIDMYSHNNIRPFIPSMALESGQYKDLVNAVLAFYLKFADTATEAEFWSGNHTYNGNTYKRNIGFCAADTTGVWFYWLNAKGNFIAGNSAFSIRNYDTPVSELGDVKIFKKSVTLDSYNCEAFVIVDWGKLTVDTVFNSCYNKESLGFYKELFSLGFSSAGANRFANINFGVDGDSITAGTQWATYVTNKLGFNTLHNVAVGSSQWQDEIITYDGNTYYPQIYGETGWLGMSDGWGDITSAEEAQKRANNSAKNHVLKFIDEVDSGSYPEPDVFVFALGTNDEVTRLGTVADAFSSTTLPDVDSTLLQTTTGAMRWCIQKIHETYPNCKILWSNMIHSTTDAREAANVTKLPVLTEVANKLSVQIIDQWNNSGISVLLEKADPHFLTDGTHPTAAGTKAIGRCACSVLSTLYFD